MGWDGNGKSGRVGRSVGKGEEKGVGGSWREGVGIQYIYSEIFIEKM